MEKIRELERYFESMKGRAVWKKGVSIATEILDVQRLKSGHYVASIMEGKFRIPPQGKGSPYTILRLEIDLKNGKGIVLDKLVRMDEPEGIATLLGLFSRLGYEIKYPWDLAKGLVAITGKGIMVDVEIRFEKEFQFIDITHVHNPLGQPVPSPAIWPETPKEPPPAPLAPPLPPPAPKLGRLMPIISSPMPPPAPVVVVEQPVTPRMAERPPEAIIEPPPVAAASQSDGDDLAVGNRILALIDGIKMEATIMALYEDSGEFVLRMPDGTKKLAMAQGAYIRKL